MLGTPRLSEFPPCRGHPSLQLDASLAAYAAPCAARLATSGVDRGEVSPSSH